MAVRVHDGYVQGQGLLHAAVLGFVHPVTGEALGGGTFTWTAAMVIEFLSMDASLTG